MLATLHDQAFDDPDWIFEIKWDGYRAIAEIKPKDLNLYSRNGLSFEGDYPIIFQELKKIKRNVVLDGEIVALDENGVSRFQLLQNYGQDNSVQLCYYVFDCLSVDGKSTEDLTVIQRKQLLKELLPKSDIIRYCDHIAERGKDFFNAMKKQGLEGMIAKRADSRYYEGARSKEWLKVKNMITEEAVIAGYTEARGGRKYFGALILGLYEGEKLKYIGHTGTGFTQQTLKDVYNKLQPLIVKESPFDTKVPVNNPTTWVRPELVCNLKYSEITEGGHRRHPVFLGLRIDKKAKDVHAEFTPPTDEKPTKPTKAMSKATPAKKEATKKEVTTKKAAVKKTVTPKVAAKPDSATKAPDRKPAAAIKAESGLQTIDGKELTLTHLDKIYWPDEGYTKGDVVDYYNSIYKYILPYMKDRPESLLRMPNGIAAKGFFQKDAGADAPDWVQSQKIWSDSVNKDIDYIICNDRPTLLYLANLGCIEMNPWNSRLAKLDNPDYLVIDLDPSDNNTFDQVIETAQVVKEILDSAGAISFPKTSGATGIHIYVPLGAKYNYDQAKDFAHMIAMLAHEQLPDITSLERSLSKRSKDHIYIDFLQNRRGQTLSCAYSLRPKPGATVSTPLEWSEVKKGLHPSDFTFKNILDRIAKKGDLFSGVLKKGIDMKKCIEKLGG